MGLRERPFRVTILTGSRAMDMQAPAGKKHQITILE
jgi:hypothetical protein